MTALRTLLEQLRKREDAARFGALTLTSKGICEEDWANNWKQYFQPFCIGDKMWISPTWVEQEPPQGRTPLRIDPGSSFGPGQHDTTKLCLALLETCVTPESRVLDIGCGSGILSICAMLLGAKSAIAIDIEQNAAAAALTNAVRNGIDPAVYETICGDILEDEALVERLGTGYDVVCANIVADILIAMRSLFMRFMREGATLLLSGIIDERLDEVLDSMRETGFSVDTVQQSGGWAAMKLSK